MAEPVAGTPMTVPWTFVFPSRRKIERVVVLRTFTAPTPGTAFASVAKAAAVAPDHSEIGELRVLVVVVEGTVEVVDRGAHPTNTPTAAVTSSAVNTKPSRWRRGCRWSRCWGTAAEGNRHTPLPRSPHVQSV